MPLAKITNYSLDPIDKFLNEDCILTVCYSDNNQIAKSHLMWAERHQERKVTFANDQL
jgi:hypothetical protein